MEDKPKLFGDLCFVIYKFTGLQLTIKVQINQPVHMLIWTLYSGNHSFHNPTVQQYINQLLKSADLLLQIRFLSNEQKCGKKDLITHADNVGPDQHAYQHRVDWLSFSVKIYSNII